MILLFLLSQTVHILIIHQRRSYIMLSISKREHGHILILSMRFQYWKSTWWYHQRGGSNNCSHIVLPKKELKNWKKETHCRLIQTRSRSWSQSTPWLLLQQQTEHAQEPKSLPSCDDYNNILHVQNLQTEWTQQECSTGSVTETKDSHNYCSVK